jgi:hypothetical protein
MEMLAAARAEMAAAGLEGVEAEATAEPQAPLTREAAVAAAVAPAPALLAAQALSLFDTLAHNA